MVKQEIFMVNWDNFQNRKQDGKIKKYMVKKELLW